jgi:hypothetical protein
MVQHLFTSSLCGISRLPADLLEEILPEKEAALTIASDSLPVGLLFWVRCGFFSMRTASCHGAGLLKSGVYCRGSWANTLCCKVLDLAAQRAVMLEDFFVTVAAAAC